MTTLATTRQFVKVGQLKEADYNPPNRTAKDRTQRLEESMKLVGMLHPITITPAREIIDGHRRLAVAKRLGWKEVECNVIDRPAEEVYASVNVTARRMSGSDALGVWLKCPRAVTSQAHRTFSKMESVIGRKTVQRIHAAGGSVRVYATAARIARYCDDLTDETVRRVVLWLLDFATIGQVMKALESGIDARKLMKAVGERKPFRLRLDVAA